MRRREPALTHARADFTGGLRLPQDETGDCNIFTTKLAVAAAELGVRFTYGAEIHSIRTDGQGVTGAVTSDGLRVADAYVVALGAHAPAIVRPLGIDLPVYPVKGYSLTVPISNEAFAPVSTVMDETYKIAITRLGDRIRVGGMAEPRASISRSGRAAGRRWSILSPTCSRMLAISAARASGAGSVQ